MEAAVSVHFALGDHVVQFYDSDDDLVGTVGAHLADALREGDAAVVIATAAHRGLFEEALSGAGVDVPGCRDAGALVVLDAAETLAAFMEAGEPDPERFDQVVGGALRAAGGAGRRVRAFGEMVAMLWDDGLVGAAIRLEELWNYLADRVPISLLCGYPSALVGGEAAYREVCHLHTGVIGGGAPAQSVTRRFDQSPLGPRRARAFVAETLRAWLAGPLEAAVLVVSELATNAVLHAASDFEVTISPADRVVRVVVRDTNRWPPIPNEGDSGADSGRGLTLVEGLSASWGYDLLDGGKRVWADLAL